MQHTHQAGQRIGRAEAGGDANVARHAARERMLALVETAAVEGKPHGLHQIDSELPLFCGRESTADFQRRSLRLQLDRFLNEAGQATPESREYRIDLSASEARAELIDQRVIGIQVQRLADERRLVPQQVRHFLEVRREHGEVALLLCFEPLHLGAGGRLRQARDEILRRRDRVIALPPHLTKIGALPVFKAVLIRFRPIQQARHTRRSHQRVAFGLERRKLFTAHVRTAARHHHGGVPAQHARSAAKGMETAEFLFELLVGS